MPADALHSDLVQMLVRTRCEHPIDDVGEWTERAATGTTLSERQAEWLVRSVGLKQRQPEIADAMDLSNGRISQLKGETWEKLAAVDKTNKLAHDLRDEIRPDPYDD